MLNLALAGQEWREASKRRRNMYLYEQEESYFSFGGMVYLCLSTKLSKMGLGPLWLMGTNVK